MKASDVQKEIIVLESMIRVLNRCMVVYYQQKQKESMKNTLRDIERCKVELGKLIQKKEKLQEHEREPANDAVK